MDLKMLLPFVCLFLKSHILPQEQINPYLCNLIVELFFTILINILMLTVSMLVEYLIWGIIFILDFEIL